MKEVALAEIFDDLSSIAETFKNIGKWFSDTAIWLYSPVQWLIDWWPLLGHFAIFAAIILVFGFIARFLPDKAKLWLLIIIGFIGAFIAGEVNQYRQRLAADKARREAEKKAKLKPPPVQPREDHGWFDRRW